MTTNEPGPNPGDELTKARRRSTISVLVAAVAVLALAVVTAVLVLRDPSDDTGGGLEAPATSVAPTKTVTATSAPTPSSPTSTGPVRRSFGYQPLWPFTSESAAAVWQRAYRAEGKQPWHLDAGQTALSFTTGFLGFDEVDTVVTTSVRGDDATVAVGYRTDSDGPSIAAVVHLARLGQGDDAPWEVVGTRDTTFTLDQPRYGAAVGSPLKVGGRITGVDESVRVDVRQASSQAPLGTFCCVPAGGTRHPWAAQVSFQGATDQVLVVVASAGGHYQEVERFAVTGVRLND